MSYSKTKKELKLSDFSSYKKLLELRKDHSPNTVLVCTDDLPDEWFITVVEYRTKSLDVTNDSMIIKKDLPVKLDWYYKNGWIALTKN
jgi:hypothetical protein